jgi:hypothetical protein
MMVAATQITTTAAPAKTSGAVMPTGCSA